MKVAFRFRPAHGTHFGPGPKLPRKMQARNMLGHFWVNIEPTSTKMPRWHVTFFQDVHFSGKKRNCATPEAHGLLAWLALACLAYLASDRPRSPCLHQQQQQRRSAPPGRRRRPGCCCEVQARRARPMRGEVSQARQGQVRRPVLAWP